MMTFVSTAEALEYYNLETGWLVNNRNYQFLGNASISGSLVVGTGGLSVGAGTNFNVSPSGYFSYKPAGIACSASQVLSWSGTINSWVCSNDSVGITGSGLTTNYLTKWNGSVVANSQVFDNGTRIGIATNAPGYTLDLSGSLRVGTGSDFTFSGKYLTYSPGGTACSNGQILSYNTASSRWQCGTDSQ